MGHRDYVYKWLFYALMTLFFILLEGALRGAFL